jgi:hypothetical protein
MNNLKHFLTENESLNEARNSKKVLSDLESYLSGEEKGSPDLQYSFKAILKAALIDANFSSEAGLLDSIFPKAKLDDRMVGNKEYWDKSLRERGIGYAKMLKWDGYDILFVFDEFAKKALPGFDVKGIME